MPTGKHGFKKKNTKAETSTPQQNYTEYIYDIGQPLEGQDLDDRIARFEATYKETRPEYQGSRLLFPWKR